jgi:hypothetical protein
VNTGWSDTVGLTPLSWMDSRQRSLLFGTFRATLFIFGGTAFSGAQAVADIDRPRSPDDAGLFLTWPITQGTQFSPGELGEVYRFEQR